LKTQHKQLDVFISFQFTFENLKNNVKLLLNLEFRLYK
jgi:hypothetical protein